MNSASLQMASLYVGDLHPDVTESMLLEKFSSVGRVYSMRLCKNKRTGTSHQYAFINFQQRASAERALELLNFDILLGQPMRIMWSQRDSSLRKNNVGNIFIKNLEKSIDSMDLYNTFSTFGNILSCKVECDENGSRGFGYVHFESAEAAETAIKRLNGMLFNGRKVFITHFKSRQERKAVNKTTAKDVNSKHVYVSQAQKKEEGHLKLEKHKVEQRVNLCVKNLDVTVDDERLRKEFSPFGTIINAKVIRFNGCSKGFGFVCFSSPEEAAKAIREMHGRVLVRKPLHITLLQHKGKRQASLSSQRTQAFQNPVLNQHQPAPPSGNVMHDIPEAQKPTANNISVQQVKPCPSTNRATQNVQLQCFQNMSEVIDPAVTHLQAISICDKKNKTTVIDAVPAAVPIVVPTVISDAVPTAVKPVPPAVPTAVKPVPPAVPIAVKVVPPAVPAAVPTAVKKAVPPAVSTAVKPVSPAVPTAVKAVPPAVPAAVKKAVPPAVSTAVKPVPPAVPTAVKVVPPAVPTAVKAVPPAVPAAVKKAVPPAVSTAVKPVPPAVPAAVKKAVPPAVSTAVKAVPPAVPTAVKVVPPAVPTAVKAVPPAVPAAVKKAVPPAVPTAVKAVPPAVKAVPPAVPAAVKAVPPAVKAVPPAVKAVPPAVPAAVKAVPPAVPAAVKAVPPAIPAAVKKAVPPAVPAAVSTAFKKAVLTEVKKAVPAALPAEVKKAVPAAVPTEVKKAVPTALPAEVKKAVPAAVPTEAKKAVPTAVPAEVKKAVPAAVPAEVKKAVPAAIPTAVPATTPVPMRDEQLTKNTMRGQDSGQSQDTETALPAPSRKPLTIYMLESADVDEQIRMLHENMLPLVEKIHPTRAKDITWMIIQGENNYDLLNMIGDPKLLCFQVEQIVAMLQAREAGQDVRLPLPKNKNKKRRKKKHFQ